MVKAVDKIVKGSEVDIPIRVYQPEGEKIRGVAVYYHWGGFISGGIEESDPECRFIADICRCTVVSVGYRLAPQHRFPAAVVDCFDVLKWVYQNVEELDVDRSRIAVIGVSAGGNLAAITSILARNNGIPLKLQILVTPVIGFDPYSESARLYGGSENPLSMDAIIDFTLKYLGDLKNAFNPLFTPILSDLRGLPPALIITAEKDALRDQGEAYADKLRKAGVPVISIRLNGVGHTLDEAHWRFVYTLVGTTLRIAFTKGFP